MKNNMIAAAAFAAVASFAGAASAQGIVPGSDYYTDAREDAKANSVIRGEVLAGQDGGTLTGTQSFGYANKTAAGTNVIVPGSDYFREAVRDAEANAVIRGDYNDGSMRVTRERGSALVPGSGAF